MTTALRLGVAYDYDKGMQCWYRKQDVDTKF
jgi:hypothetical protein